ERDAVDEIETSGGLGRALPIEEPLLRCREQSRHILVAVAVGRMTLDLAHQPGFERQHVRARPDASAACELRRRVGHSQRMRPLARGHEHCAAALEDYAKVARNFQQYRNLALIPALLLES